MLHLETHITDMIKRISALSTTYHKLIFPALWTIGFGMGTLMIWIGSFSDKAGHKTPSDAKLLFLVFWIAGTLFNIWFSLRVKHVWLEDDHLIIKNFKEKKIVPVWQIEEVTETRFWRPKMIKIKLKEPTIWGDQIVFIAPLSMKLILFNHPVVIELREMASKPRRV
jgi:hypothetical protein